LSHVAAVAVRNLFPRDVSVSLWSGQEMPELCREETEFTQRSVPKRRLEFARGRAAARHALSELGVPRQAIPVGPGRQPTWPEGFVGSITHCEGLVAAVAASAVHLSALGIDAEPARALPPETRELVLHDSEMSPDPLMEMMVFSAKESIHKALYPATEAWMDFLDVELRVDRVESTFVAVPKHGRPKPPTELGLLRGRFALVFGFVVTGCWISAAVPSA